MKFPRIFGGRQPVEEKSLSTPLPSRGGGWFSIFESFSGAWQQNVEINRDTVLAYHAVFACMTLIASDISKLRMRTVKLNSKAKVWEEYNNPTYSPLLRRPNSFQTWNQFMETWILSKLSHGNAYVLKQRNARGAVEALYVLDPARARVLVATNGDVFYDLSDDALSRLYGALIIPAAEMIHDRYNCLYHPLLGMSPLMASGLAAMQGNAIQNNSANLFKNASMPSGILTAPGTIKDETALRLKRGWEENFNGKNFGKVAVLGDGLKFDMMSMKATDAQMLEQLKWSADIVCSTFHVPPYKIGVGPQPTYNNVQALNVEYYSQCLQRLIEDLETCLDEGLGFKAGDGVEADITGLLRMDQPTRVTSLKDAVAAGIMAPNEARQQLDLMPVVGGDTPYLQQQNYSLEALNERGAAGLIPEPAAPAPLQLPAPVDTEEEDDGPTEEERRLALQVKTLEDQLAANRGIAAASGIAKEVVDGSRTYH